MFWIFLIHGFSVASCYHTVTYTYHFINVALTWPDAQRYCREQHYTDLATVHDRDDLDKLVRPSTYTGAAWIGLFDDTASWKVLANDPNSWIWSATGTTSTSQYQNWINGEPNYIGLPKPGFKTYTFIPTYMSWKDAQSYCRQHHTDLAMIEDATENSAVASLIGSYSTWFGMFRKPWRWSDGSTSNFKNWGLSRPDNYELNRHCVWENHVHEWVDWSCSERLPFFCHRAETGKRQLLTMKLQSKADLSHPAVWSQLLKKIEEELLNMGLSHLIVRWKDSPKGV